MYDKRITVRAATREDSALIAQAVAMAIGDETTLQSYCGDDYLTQLAEIATQDNTQYSWQCALVAEYEGVAAGAVVGYDGAQLRALRDGTFAILRDRIGHTPTIADETEAGEFYLDSLGVLPQFHGLGVGRALIAGLCTKAFAAGHERMGLLVDFDNPRAEQLYTSLGFHRVGEKMFFGHRMWHLQIESHTRK